ncbi:hypothetical protein LCGC14_0808040 [marine sediment metagenome]|uniref:Large polyvalent protein associated domain-containing protein n=1 Tax=marine sediment metagenome TaxID=412755 RepID=A0A0F9SV21_9ZZZZ
MITPAMLRAASRKWRERKPLQPFRQEPQEFPAVSGRTTQPLTFEEAGQFRPELERDILEKNIRTPQGVLLEEFESREDTEDILKPGEYLSVSRVGDERRVQVRGSPIPIYELVNKEIVKQVAEDPMFKIGDIEISLAETAMIQSLLIGGVAVAQAGFRKFLDIAARRLMVKEGKTRGTVFSEEALDNFAVWAERNLRPSFLTKEAIKSVFRPNKEGKIPASQVKKVYQDVYDATSALVKDYIKIPRGTQTGAMAFGGKIPPKPMVMSSARQAEELSRANAQLDIQPIAPNTVGSIGVGQGELIIRTDANNKAMVTALVQLRDNVQTVTMIVKAQGLGEEGKAAVKEVLDYNKEHGFVSSPDVTEYSEAGLARFGAPAVTPEAPTKPSFETQLAANLRVAMEQPERLGIPPIEPSPEAPRAIPEVAKPPVTPEARRTEIQELLATPAKQLPKGTSKIELRQELAKINKSLVPAEKKLRQQIMAVKAGKFLPQSQLREIIKANSGKTHLTDVFLTDLQKILKAVQGARPKKIKGKNIITKSTEQNIQSLKKELIGQEKLNEETYQAIKKNLGLKHEGYISPSQFISEAEGRNLIRQINYESEVGLIERDVKIAKALEQNAPLRKDIEKLRAGMWVDDPSVARDISNFWRQIASFKKMPEGADVSGLWSARYRFEKLGIRTKDVRWHRIEQLISNQAKTGDFKVKEAMQRLKSSTPSYTEISGDEKALKRVSDYIASKNNMGVESPKDIKPGEIKLAKIIEKELFKYRNDIRYARFQTWYDHFNGDTTLMMTKIKDAPKGDLVEGIRIYESKGEKALREYLDTKEWGVIKSGFEPHIAVNPRLVDYKISEAVIGKGRLSSREGIEFTEQDVDILKRTESYFYYMEKLHLRPYFQHLSRVYSENVPKLSNPQSIKRQLEAFMSEAKGGRPIEHPVLKLMSKVAAVGYNTIFKFPHLSFRNLHQSFAFHRDKSSLINPLNKRLPDDIKKLFNIRDSQMVGTRRDLLLNDVLGSGRLARFMKRTDHYPWSDQIGRMHTFWGSWNKARRALERYRKTGDFPEFLKASGGNELTIQQQIDIAENMALEKISYADGAVTLPNQESGAYEVASQMAANVHFIYDRLGRSTWEYGPEGRVLTSLFIFPKSYFEQLLLNANRIKPGSQANPAAKARAWKALIAIIVGGILVGNVYEKIAGKGRNPYNPLNLIAYSGGLAIGLTLDISQGINLMIQAAQGEDWARAELTTHLPGMADSFLPFYKSTIDILESLTGTQYIDRLALRKLRAAFDKDYMPNEEYYLKERDILGKIKHALFGGEDPKPEGIEAAQTTIDEAIGKLGTNQLEKMEKALEGVENPAKIAEIRARDWTYTTKDLGSVINTQTKTLDEDEKYDFFVENDLANYYFNIKHMRDFYYEELTNDEKKAMREQYPDFLYGMIFWGTWQIRTPQEKSAMEQLARHYGIPLDAIPAVRKEEPVAPPTAPKPPTRRTPVGGGGVTDRMLQEALK